jgi:drug/metabolite transporter (DMT)-like permease
VTKDDGNSTSQIYSSLIPTIILFPFAINNWVWPDTWLTFFIMGLMGVAATLGHSFTTIAHRLAKASSLAPVIYVQLIFMTSISWIVFKHLPNPNTVLGTVIIILTGIYVLRLETANVRKNKFD